jgi:hypothetical protein
VKRAKEKGAVDLAGLEWYVGRINLQSSADSLQAHSRC